MAWLSASVLLTTVSVAPKTLMMPPPTPSPLVPMLVPSPPAPPMAWLPTSVEPIRYMVAVWLSMPPPLFADSRPPAGDVADQRAVANGTRAVGIIHDRPADTEAPVPACGLVVQEGRVADRHGRAGALAIDGAAVAGDARAATGRVPEEDGVVDGRRGGVRQVQAGVVLDGTADAEVTRAGAERLVVVERAGGHRQGGAAEVVDAAADAAAEEGGAAAAEGLVAAEGGGGDGGSALVEQAAAEDIDRVGGGGRRVVVHGTVQEGQGRPRLVEDAAPAEAADGLIVRHRAVVENQSAGVIDAAARQGFAVGDGQAAKGHARQATDVEDPAGGM